MENKETVAHEVMDLQQALMGVDRDEALLKELAGLFLDDCPEMLADLRARVAAGELRPTERTAHTLKGSAAILAATTVTALAHDLERAARAGDLEASRSLFARLEQEMARLIARLEELVAA